MFRSLVLVPILFTAGRTPITEGSVAGARNLFIHWTQEMFDQAGMLREMVKWDYELRNAQQLETVVDRAIAVAMSPPRGPIHLTLPREVLARDGRRFSTVSRWRDRLCAILENGSGCHAGTVAEADSVLESADDKLLLHTLSGALIADMESAAIAEACQGAGRPLLVVRAVSDRVATRIPHCALAAVDANGDVKLARCLGSLLLAPGDLPALLRLARGFRAACAALSGLAQRAGPAFLLSASERAADS